MKIEVCMIKGKGHRLKFRRCPICNIVFAKYSAAARCCSNKCELRRRCDWRNDYNRKLKETPEGAFRCRKSTIILREKERREKYRSEIPKLKQALEKGDDALLEYLLENWTIGSSRTRKKYSLPEGTDLMKKGDEK
jgi:hypothetical protein